MEKGGDAGSRSIRCSLPWSKCRNRSVMYIEVFLVYACPINNDDNDCNGDNYDNG